MIVAEFQQRTLHDTALLHREEQRPSDSFGCTYIPYRMSLTHKRQPPQPPSWDGPPLSPQRKNALSTPPNVMPLHTNSPASASQGSSSLILGDSGRQHGTRPQPFLTAESCHSYFELIPGNYRDVALLLWLTSALDEFFKR